MKIKKIGHCCLVVDVDGTRIMTDPGNFSKGQENEENISIVLITHEHGDHLHVESLKAVLARNPEAVVVTNGSVGAILEGEGIAYTKIAHGDKRDVKAISLEGLGTEHAYIYEGVTPVENTGYFIADTLFYPGDAWNEPLRPVDILALPVAGPWMKISEALDYCIKLKPRIAFPVHDALIAPDKRYAVHKLPGIVLEKAGIGFMVLNEGDEMEF